MKKYKNLSKKEKHYWEERAKNLSNIDKIWINLIEEKKCIWCNKKFPDGIVKKHPGKIVCLNAYAWFTSEFLLHTQTTHGYSPDDITIFIENFT